MSWLFEDTNEYRDEAQAVLDEVKRRRKRIRTRFVRIDPTTWIEQQVSPFKNSRSAQNSQADMQPVEHPVLRPLPFKNTLL